MRMLSTIRPRPMVTSGALTWPSLGGKCAPGVIAVKDRLAENSALTSKIAAANAIAFGFKKLLLRRLCSDEVLVAADTRLSPTFAMDQKVTQ